MRSKLASHRLVLASQSPRRRELLERAGFDFTVTSVQISEIPDENLNLLDQVPDLARRKALACLNSGMVAKGQGNLLISADTVVSLDGQILGKPESVSENARFMEMLSGRKHSVITGVCLLDVDSGVMALGREVSTVEFRELLADEIRAYVESGEGLDKAGGYGIQGAAGKFVAKVEGPWDNIVGLPIALVETLLEQNGWHVGQR